MAAASMDIAPEWLDGYLAAIVVAPKIVMPSGWPGGLLEREHEFAGDDELQRFLDLLLLRYNAANDAMADADAPAHRNSSLSCPRGSPIATQCGADARRLRRRRGPLLVRGRGQAIPPWILPHWIEGMTCRPVWCRMAATQGSCFRRGK